MTRMASRPRRRHSFASLFRAVLRDTFSLGIQLVVLLSSAMLLFAAATSPWMTITAVEVSGNSYLIGDDIVSQMDYQGQNLLRLDLAEMERRLCASPWIVDAHLNYRPLHRLQLEVTEAEPVALHRRETNWYICSATGEQLPWESFARPLLLPVLREVAADELVSVCRIASHVKNCYPALYAELQSIALGECLVLTIGAPGVAAWLERERLDHQLTKLELFLARPEMHNGNVSHIDLRFDNKLIARRRQDA